VFEIACSLVSLGEEGVGFSDFLLELLVELEVLSDLLDGQVDEHSSDLGCFVFTGDLLDEFEDDFSDLMLVVSVLGDDSGDEGH
jgi:hypothetical protein